MRPLVLLIVSHVMGCSLQPAPAQPECQAVGTNVRTFDVDALLLPVARASYAIDLNGDQVVDNQIGDVVSALTGSGIPLQAVVNDAFKAGKVHLRLQVTSTDAAQVNAVQAGASLSDLSLAGSGGSFCARLSEGAFDAPNPAQVTTPETISITLPFFDDVVVDLAGAHVEFTINGDRATGRLHGGISAAQITDRVMPAIADFMTRKVQGDPLSALSKELASIFDSGGEPDDSCAPRLGCRNPPPPVGNGACALPNDGIVDACEISTDAIAKNILAPDVQLFSEDGSVYQPSAGNAHKDSLSVGIAFTAQAVPQ